MIPFEDMGLDAGILRSIADLGFQQPTPIQQLTIPHLLNTREDLIATAQTGTGKTAGFGLPILQQLDLQSKNAQAIILCPTRELCIQIARDLESFSKHTKGLYVTPVYGGASMETQVRALKKGSHVVVGTPGRTLDLLNRKVLKLENIRWLVLDEADEMLSMGFKEELDAIMEAVPTDAQSLLFSATMPAGVKRLAKSYMKDAKELSVAHAHISTGSVKHGYFLVSGRDRFLALKRIADMNPNIYAIVFCRTRRETKEIADKMSAEGYAVDALHGDLSQGQRDFVMGRFRNKQIRMLIATDVAARGLDVNDLSHVIHYNLPDDDAAYVHRSGRTGRGDKTGVSLAIVHVSEKKRIAYLEKVLGRPIEQMKVPTGKEICERQLFHLINRMETIEVHEEQIGDFLPVIYKKLEWMSKEDLITRFVSVEFNRFLSYYKDARDLSTVSGRGDRNDRGERGERGERGDGKRTRGEKDGKGYTFGKFVINLGVKHRFKPSILFQMINQQLAARNIEIGRIEIQKNFTVFELDQAYEKKLLKSFGNVKYKGLKVVVEEWPSGDDDGWRKDQSHKGKKKRGRK
ncbi:MAG: DEAD/DEAH box helicase [Flavobacteriales bacterium]|nr:DEAD/DEAH box helicase [Flavobacteriales bacterium]